MLVEKRKLRELVEMEDNPRKANENFYEDLRKSIEEFGYIIPIIINKRNNKVISGNQRLKVLREMYGDDYEVDVVVVDLDEREEKELNILMNSTKTKFAKKEFKNFVKEIKDEVKKYNFAKNVIDAKKISLTIDLVFTDEGGYMLVKKKFNELKKKYGVSEYGEAVYMYLKECDENGN